MDDFSAYENLYVVVDTGVCTACGSCQAYCPDVFAYDEKFVAYNRLDGNTGTKPIPLALWDDVAKTRYCQTRAIKYSDTPFENFKPTEEFDDESPENVNVTYTLGDDEWERDDV